MATQVNFLRFIPLFQETLDRIRARFDADVNAGIVPSDPGFLDTTPGGFYYDLTQAPALEIERLWNALALEYVAAVFPGLAWGTWLDEHGVTINEPRKDAVAASGQVTFSGANGTLVSVGVQVATQSTDPDADPIIFQTIESGTISGGSVTLNIEALTKGTIGNVPGGAITLLNSAITGVTSVTNADATSSGANVESDESYRLRILLAYSGAHGPGTIADYEKWALEYPGVGFVTVTPIWDGPGTVRVVVTDTENNPLPDAVVTGLQLVLDPVAGQGRGTAPIGASVTVATPTTLDITGDATLHLEDGYSLDGDDGSIAIRDDVTDALNSYVNTLKPGEDVVIQHFIGRCFLVTGVFDVTGVTLNGDVVNVAVGSLEVAQLTALTLESA